jgi:hypothetical protein
MPEPTPYPGPEHISYDEDSRWCQDHGHTGLLLTHPGMTGCEICNRLVATDPRFAAALTKHLPDGSRRRARPEENTTAKPSRLPMTLTAMEHDTRRALAVLDRAIPADGTQATADLRAAAFPELLRDLLDNTYESDGPYAHLAAPTD